MNANLPDIPRIYTALAEWLSCLIFILEVKRRFSTRKFAAISFLALIIQSLFLVITQGQEGIWWVSSMAIAIFWLYLYIYSCADISKRYAGYLCVRAFIVAEFVASLHWQIHCYYFQDQVKPEGISQYFLLFGVYAGAFLVIAIIFRRSRLSGVSADVSGKELIFMLATGLSTFVMSNLGFISSQTPFSGTIKMDVFNVRTLVGLCGVAIVYAYQVSLSELKGKRELESMESILHNQYTQYQQSQESINIINYQYHDLKNHILVLRQEGNINKRNEYLDKMDEEIKQYEAQNKTGNKVLDTLLTSKKLYCIQKDICMTSVVDGSLLSFMEVMDICSIFGNALDNAIACEEKIAEKEKRLIHISTFPQSSFLIIRFENYCEDDIKFKDGLPITTQKDKKFHGYGLKSIRHAISKYGGEMDISVKNNWFSINILVPLTSDMKSTYKM